MADTAKRIIGPTQLAVTETTLYTVPAATTTIVRHIHIANTTALAAAVKLSIGADAAGTRFLGDLSIAANAAYDWSGMLVLTAAETLRATAGTALSLTIIASGVEVT